MTIDPGTSSVVASSSCSVELLLDIFWAVFTGFSRFLVVVCERSFFYASPRICSSFQNREEPMAYFEKRFCSFLALQTVTNLFGFLSRCFFGFARQELSFGFLPSSLPFCFFFNTFSRNFECEVFPQIFQKFKFKFNSDIHFRKFVNFQSDVFRSTSCILFHDNNNFCSRPKSAISLYAQVQFHA